MTEPTAPHPARTRTSILRAGIVLLCTAATGWAGFQAVSALVTTPALPGPSAFASYVDVTTTPAYPFETPSGPAQANVILAFVVAGPGHPCTPMWGGAYTLAQAQSDLQLDRRISQLQITGGTAAVSFGGALGDELASVCTDPDALRRAYQSVVDRYKLTSIDLDIEGTSLENVAAVARRAAAIKEVQSEVTAKGRSLAVWLTLPVSPQGLTDPGIAAVAGMLAADVNLAGVNGMTMDFGTVTSPAKPMSGVVIQAATALHKQVRAAFATSGRPLGDAEAWGKVGITPMIGQNDVAAERFTLSDAAAVSQFARAKGVGALSMWSLNRDATCGPPLPAVLTVVQTACSGIDQGAQRFAKVLAADLTFAPLPSTSAPSDKRRSANPTPNVVDDPAHSPFPIWDPLGAYPGATKTVWHRQVFQARYWTTGFAPDTPVANAQDSPWTLLGPVLPGDTPAPLPTLAAGTYPQWDPTRAYVEGSRVQRGLVPYQAKWWSKGQQPGVAVAGGAPWILILPN